MKIEQHRFAGNEIDGFYSWYDSGVRDGKIRIVNASLNNEDGVQRYTLVENNDTAITVDRIVPQQGQPEIIGLAKVKI